MTTPENITQALAAVMQEVGYVQKKKQGGVNYTFASESDLIAAVRPWFVEYGIVVYPSHVNDLRIDSYTTSRGSVMNRTVVIMEYTFAHAKSGTYLTVMTTGEGADIGDKSANKALTGAYKYALREALLIETGDDPDKDPSEGPPAQTKQQYTDDDRERMASKAVKRITSIPDRPPSTNGDEPDDKAKKAYWQSLSDTEKEIYRNLGALLPAIVSECQRYDNRIAAKAAVEKLFPALKDEDWPSANTWDDASTRVQIFKTVKAYASLRDAGMDSDKATDGAFSQVRANA